MKNVIAATKIKEFMRKKPMKQIELAELSGFKQSVISDMLNGKRNILPLIDFFRDKFNMDFASEMETPIASFVSGVPYYNVDFIGGFELIVNDQTVNPEYYIDFKPYEKATCWCNITGHSMEPEISHGDVIALRKIDDWRFLPFGEIYAIVTQNDMRTVKRLGPGSSDDTYMLIPANKSGDYSPQEINKSDIMCVFEVMGCMKKF